MRWVSFHVIILWEVEIWLNECGGEGGVLNPGKLDLHWLNAFAIGGNHFGWRLPYLAEATLFLFNNTLIFAVQLKKFVVAE